MSLHHPEFTSTVRVVNCAAIKLLFLLFCKEVINNPHPRYSLAVVKCYICWVETNLFDIKNNLK